MTAFTHAEMLAFIEAAPAGAAHPPAGREDDDWEHNARVLDDLFREGWVTADFPAMKDGAGAYAAVVGLRLTDRGRRRVREFEAEDASGGVVVATPAQVQAVEAVLTVLRRLDDELEGHLDQDQAATLDAERTALEAAIRSPRPNRGVLRAALAGVKWVADSIGQGVIGAAVAAAVQALA